MAGLREVCFDTETTGLSAEHDRVAEIAAIELIDYIPTGREFHCYINPQRRMPEEATRIHGLTDEFLKDKPKFQEIIDDFLQFVGDASLVAHNAQFDFKMVNSELRRLRKPPLKNIMIDTVALSKIKFPGAKASLDDLCRRFGIDLSKRTTHTAILDTRLLGAVYLELRGGRHCRLDLEGEIVIAAISSRPFRAPRMIGGPTEEELSRHTTFVSKIDKAVWNLLDSDENSPSSPSP
jgi:DNA polymerase III subunit epsilon